VVAQRRCYLARNSLKYHDLRNFLEFPYIAPGHWTAVPSIAVY